MLKTSKEWCKHFDCVVFDPDGWDRKNYEYSFNEEMVSEAEFRKRAKKSSMLVTGTLGNT